MKNFKIKNNLCILALILTITFYICNIKSYGRPPIIAKNNYAKNSGSNAFFLNSTIFISIILTYSFYKFFAKYTSLDVDKKIESYETKIENHSTNFEVLKNLLEKYKKYNNYYPALKERIFNIQPADKNTSTEKPDLIQNIQMYLELRSTKEQLIFNVAVITPEFINEQTKNNTSLNEKTIFLIDNPNKEIIDKSITNTITYVVELPNFT